MIVLFHPDPATNRNSAILVVQFSPRPPIVLLHLGPATNRISAILVEQVPNGTHMQDPSELSFGTEVVLERHGAKVFGRLLVFPQAIV